MGNERESDNTGEMREQLKRQFLEKQFATVYEKFNSASLFITMPKSLVCFALFSTILEDVKY